MLRILAVIALLVLVGCGGDGDEEDAAGAQGLRVELAAQNGSGESGSAELTANADGGTRITVQLSNAPHGVPHPSHVHEGTCDSIGDVVAPLEDVVHGEAETVVDMSLQELRRGGLIVHAHKSEAEYKTSVACAEIPSLDESTRGY